LSDKDKTAVAKTSQGSDYTRGEGLITTLNKFNIPVFVVSGANYDDVNEDVTSSGLPIDGIACDVGTNSYVRDIYGKDISDRYYEEKLIPFSGKKKDIVKSLKSVFEQFEGYNLRFQNNKHEAVGGNWERFMANLYFDIPLDTESSEVATIIKSIYTEVQGSLIDVGIEIKFNLCEEFKNNKNPERETNRYCLDVLAGNKDGALNQTVYALEILQPDIDLPILTAGDSGNDISLFSSPNCDMFVIVGGADKAADSDKSYLQQVLKILVLT
jgi:hydroxymethylpyrimidine pyrophosphatase-like HAD family hydrolase